MSVLLCHRCPHAGMVAGQPIVCRADPELRDIAITHLDPPAGCPSAEQLRSVARVVGVTDPAQRREICMGCDEGGGGSPDGEWMACRLAVGGCGNRNPGQVKLTVGRCPLGKWERVSTDVRPSFDAAATSRERPVG